MSNGKSIVLFGASRTTQGSAVVSLTIHKRRVHQQIDALYPHGSELRTLKIHFIERVFVDASRNQGCSILSDVSIWQKNPMRAGIQLLI